MPFSKQGKTVSFALKHAFAAKRALMASGKFIPWQVVTVSTDGRIID